MMATIKDVAKEAGLTVTTVSRILNNRGYISDSARQKVADAMKKLNYRPNEVARSLQNRSSNIIGLIVPHIRHPYFAEAISNVENEAYKKGYKILLCNSQCMDEREREYIEICSSNRVAGIILFSGQIAVDAFVKLDVPVITIERFLDNGTASVECDNYEGGKIAARKLIACGCRHLVHVGSVNRNLPMPADLRSRGFQEICDQEGVSFLEMVTEEDQFNSMNYAKMLEGILTDYPETDGIFTNNDIIAAQALQVCHRLGMSVPGRLKIIGFDDVSIASLTTPMLTTLHQPMKEIAETAVDLLDRASKGRLVARRTVLPVTLIERETT